MLLPAFPRNHIDAGPNCLGYEYAGSIHRSRLYRLPLVALSLYAKGLGDNPGHLDEVAISLPDQNCGVLRSFDDVVRYLVRLRSMIGGLSRFGGCMSRLHVGPAWMVATIHFYAAGIGAWYARLATGSR
ncbi:hypothetical protein EXZ48_34110 [Shinella sp. JR1-6]|nr:hypothetical protein EXZ48_34110 [Shinella sp. JR1-6]